MFSIMTILGLVSKGWSIIGPAIKSMGEVTVAMIAAIPAIIAAVGGFLKAIGESPVLSLLFGGVVCGTIAFFYGLSFDGSIRERHKRDAIRIANARADVAIANVRKQYEARIATICRQTKCPKR